MILKANVTSLKIENSYISINSKNNNKFSVEMDAQHFEVIAIDDIEEGLCDNNNGVKYVVKPGLHGAMKICKSDTNNPGMIVSHLGRLLDKIIIQ